MTAVLKTQSENFSSWSRISSDLTNITIICIVGFSRDYVIISIPVVVGLTPRPQIAVILSKTDLSLC